MVSPVAREATLSPRDFAQALGVSESSVKRWIDAGRVPAQRTTGGHRRIELLPALRFLHDSGRELAQPEALGLPASAELCLRDPSALGERVLELLRKGQRRKIVRLLLAALATRSTDPAALFDGPLRAAMARIGNLWKGGIEGIYAEHRATQTLLRVIDRLEALYDPVPDELVAVGGALDGDPSLLPSRMAATVLAAAGIRPVNLGADTPAPVFLEAVDETGARLVWVSVSFVSDPGRQGRALARLVDELEERGLVCILGGRQIHRLEPQLAGKARIGRSMSDLAALAREIVEERER